MGLVTSSLVPEDPYRFSEDADCKAKRQPTTEVFIFKYAHSIAGFLSDELKMLTRRVAPEFIILVT